MSCTCNGCFKVIAEPDSFWFACTRYSPNICYFCGTCVSLIPPEKRRPTAEKQEGKISFGTMDAQTGSYGRYQGSGSSQRDIRFWVEIEDIEKHIPESEYVLTDLYPYFCPDEYIADLTEKIAAGQENLYFELGGFLAKINRFREAIDQLLRVPEQHEDYQWVLYHLVRSYRALQMKEEGEKWRTRITDPDMLAWLNGSNHIVVRVKKS